MIIKKVYALLVLFSISAISSDITYSYVPKRVYQKQVFPVAFVGSEKIFGQISFNFKNKIPIVKNAVESENRNKVFYTFYFKATKNPFIIESVEINIDGEKVIKLDKKIIEVQPTPQREDFCGVMASEFKIKSAQSSIYDEKSNLVTLQIEAYEANLEDMYIKDGIKDGIENIRMRDSRVEGNYYIVLPADQKTLEFSYFNLIKNSFVTKMISIDIDSGSVAAQTDLNPKDDKFELFKKYILIFTITIFLILFIWKKDLFYLIIAFFVSLVLSLLYIPLSKICVKANSPIYIIPTFNSTISGYTDHEVVTLELAKRGTYHKVEYKKGIIGWIKDEDICKN